MPRTCSYFNVNGQPVIACGRTKIQACHVCGEIAGKLCDWKVNGGTCDVPMCDTHAHQVGPNKDLCFRHANVWRTHAANKQRKLVGKKVPLEAGP